MGKIIVITFAFMTFAFYELSDGNEFVPIANEKRAALALEQAEEIRVAAAAKAERLAAEPAPVAEVTQTVDLASVVKTPAPETTLETSDALELALDDVKADDLALETVVAEAAVFEPTPDLREVTAARVNMRQGPGQNFDVIAKLTNGQQVEILQDAGDGWVKLRVSDSGREGWMADFLLTASNN